MSSAYKSRDLNPPGKVPTIELGYPAVVLFTFSPSEKESSEIPVLEACNFYTALEDGCLFKLMKEM